MYKHNIQNTEYKDEILKLWQVRFAKALGFMYCTLFEKVGFELNFQITN